MSEKVASNLIEDKTTIVLDEGQAAVVFNNSTPPDIYLPKVENEQQAATPSQMMAVLNAWLMSKPEKLGQLLDEMQDDLEETEIIVP